MRSRNIHFIPRSFNFSEMNPVMIEQLSEEAFEPDISKEQIILESIHAMKNDKQRIIFFFEILREYGYQIDCESIAHALNIERRWYQRIKQSMRRLIERVV